MNQDQQSSFQQPLQKYKALAERRDQTHFAFLRQVFLAAASSLSILVALHTESAAGQCIASVLYVSALSSLLLAVLTLLAALHGEVFVSRQRFLQYSAKLQRMWGEGHTTPEGLSDHPPKIYGFCETIGYIAFALAMLFLTGYAALQEFG